MDVHCRIGRVKLRGGASLHQVPRPPRDERQAGIIRAAGKVAKMGETDPLGGYVVIGFFHDGGYSVGWHLDPDHIVGPAMLPSYAADIMRRALIEVGAWGPED